jgi:hypothetical protein
MSPQTTTAPIRVFISYAWEDDDYRQWVARLAAQLIEDGIDARLDCWHVQVGQTIPGFMNSEVRLADKVLVLCSPKYRQKVHTMEDGGPSTGSGWESMLLSSAMFTQAPYLSSFIQPFPAVESVPLFIQALLHIGLLRFCQVSFPLIA